MKVYVVTSKGFSDKVEGVFTSEEDAVVSIPEGYRNGEYVYDEQNDIYSYFEITEVEVSMKPINIEKTSTMWMMEED